nr:unnamed protein product [Digitaria exilis]
MAEMRWRRLLEEAVGVTARHARQVTEVIGVVVRGQTRGLTVVIDVVVRREVGVVRVVERRRMVVVASAAAAAGKGGRKWVVVAAGHEDWGIAGRPEPYRWPRPNGQHGHHRRRDASGGESFRQPTWIVCP